MEWRLGSGLGGICGDWILTQAEVAQKGVPVGLSMKRRLVCSGAAAGLVALSVGIQIALRTPLSMDELHTVLLAQLLAEGQPPSFYVGSVTRYEGGSYLMAAPVAVLLWLGCWGTAAASWAAGAVAVVTVFLTALWLTRLRGLGSALALGAGAALLSPELLHYSFRAWGSLSESLLLFPLLGLTASLWVRRGTPRWGPPVFGVLLGLGVVFSYWHMVTSLVVAGLLVARHGRQRWSRGLRDVARTAFVALALFGLWLALALPFLSESFMVRDGLLLHKSLPKLLLVRVDQVVLHLPGAWIGEHLEATILRQVCGAALGLLSVAAAAVAWRRGGELRWLAVLFLACFPAVSVGLAMLEPPEVYRYYIPLLAISVTLLAAWDWRAMVVALLISLGFWLPAGMERPGQSSERSHMELGGNALHRYASNPHVKYDIYRRVVQPANKQWFAFGYGLDSGLRYRVSQEGMKATVRETGASAQNITEDPHMALFYPRSWLEVAGDPEGDLPYFLRGMGVGLGADRAVDKLEAELLAAADPDERAELMAGLGASLGAALFGQSMASSWRTSLGDALLPSDWEQLVRGARAAAGGRLKVSDSALQELGAEAQTAVVRGLAGPPVPNLSAMLGVPLVPTPQPPPPTVF